MKPARGRRHGELRRPGGPRRQFLEYSAEFDLKRIVLECGGKNPALVLPDAPDLDAVAQPIVDGAFRSMAGTARAVASSEIELAC
ncbi:hypothetical protein A8E81_15705 [Burkholderia cenocepacia]|uniref:aldehyde dehydrogenase family protein n=1 Tax=unclassified Burkholderia TaxID=2613784 RepID=UPI000982CC6A|nr:MULTISPECIES: aldehyde dehydrogenase family protein [unclassified Burkholderia]AQQ38929.1 hypothetical protein A8E75_07905 [Burkholderia cenocepacia]ONV16159.1 hypothetical protein A8E74_29310 [Burkholderia cenocepacia]ONV32751.1 hypothetical protein A8E78_13435 [Burkholderia cenocepacia]ONV37220.1 hypothetical protein A8E77_09305 [Burkholderia cenocepacia]ONV43778.1 hypothetical protein A8E82_11295 [Burkholderia cenocepacia]